MLIAASCSQQKTKIVYVQKPLMDTTVLKAEFKGQEWVGMFNKVIEKSAKLDKPSQDTIRMVINSVLGNISDSNRNPIFKK